MLLFCDLTGKIAYVSGILPFYFFWFYVRIYWIFILDILNLLSTFDYMTGKKLCHPGNCSWAAWHRLMKLDNLTEDNRSLQIFQRCRWYIKKIWTLKGRHEASSVLNIPNIRCDCTKFSHLRFVHLGKEYRCMWTLVTCTHLCNVSVLFYCATQSFYVQ